MPWKNIHYCIDKAILTAKCQIKQCNINDRPNKPMIDLLQQTIINNILEKHMAWLRTFRKDTTGLPGRMNPQGPHKTHNRSHDTIKNNIKLLRRIRSFSGDLSTETLPFSSL